MLNLNRENYIKKHINQKRLTDEMGGGRWLHGYTAFPRLIPHCLFIWEYDFCSVKKMNNRKSALRVLLAFSLMNLPNDNEIQWGFDSTETSCCTAYISKVNGFVNYIICPWDIFRLTGKGFLLYITDSSEKEKNTLCFLFCFLWFVFHNPLLSALSDISFIVTGAQ